jgi:hypothetical protein
MSEWLHEEGVLDAELAFVGKSGLGMRSLTRSAEQDTSQHNLAVFLKPLVVRNTRKWFGEADIRVDALVTQAGQEGGSLYQPRTIRFPRVADGDDLANEENGLMVYYGKPKHFLVLTVTLARDSKDSDDLATLINAKVGSDEVSSVMTQLGAAVASPHVAAVQVAMQAALTLGNVAYQLIRQLTPKCLGLYRANWLARKDNFGIGRHPAEGSLSIKDFDFAYEVAVDATDN